jgi:hypothetical protein
MHEYIWIQAVPGSSPGYFDFNFRGLYLFLHQFTIVIFSRFSFLFGIKLIIFWYLYSIILSFYFALRNLKDRYNVHKIFVFKQTENEEFQVPSALFRKILTSSGETQTCPAACSLYYANK